MENAQIDIAYQNNIDNKQNINVMVQNNVDDEQIDDGNSKSTVEFDIQMSNDENGNYSITFIEPASVDS